LCQGQNLYYNHWPQKRLQNGQNGPVKDAPLPTQDFYGLRTKVIYRIVLPSFNSAVIVLISIEFSTLVLIILKH